MAVLGRVAFVAQQRVDLHHYLAMESFTAADFRSVITALVGNDKPYIARGLKVVGKNGLTVSIQVANSQIFNPLDNNASFYSGLSDDEDLNIDLPADQSNIFVEATFQNTTQAPTNAGIWNPSTTTGEDSSGEEYTASIDTQNIVYLEVTANTVGFSDGSIPLFRASTSASAITDFVDSRDLMFRLGSGGAVPDPLNKYNWSATRTESIPNGTGVGDAADSPWRSSDTSGAVNDKSFESLKDWMDAVMTRIGELDTFPWYKGSASSTGISLPKLFFDTIGHSIQPSKNSSFKWTQVSGDLRLISEGTETLNGITSQYHTGIIKWKANNSNLEWHLGGDFFSALKRNYTSSGLRFESPAVEDGGNIYLYLEREVQKGSGNSVNWGDAGSSSFNAQESVSGTVGDFSGIAIGDYIRKDSGTLNDYYKVIGMYDGTNTYSIVNDVDQNKVADSTIISLQLQSVINPDVTNISSTVEPLKFFRSRYSSADVVADTTLGANGLIHNYQNVDFYWLGRREGELFFLRDYGTMQDGEEATTIDMVYAHGGSAGNASLALEHSKEAAYDTTNGYYLKAGVGSLLKIHRRKRDNTSGHPSSLDNSGSLLTYTIDAAITDAMSVGQNLWVRLSDSTGGTLVQGNITVSVDDETNTDGTTNVWQILADSDSPRRTFDNADVFMLAKRLDINGQESLMFCDGSVLTEFGRYLDTNLDVSGELRLSDYDNKAIPFIAEDGSKLLDQDSANFFFDKTNAIFGLFNLRVENNDIHQNTPEDISLFSNLGAHTATIGTLESTVAIPGNLVVTGKTFVSNTENVQSEDSLITLGVGALLGQNFGAGIEVADDTRYSDNISVTIGNDFATLNYSGALAYTLGDMITINSIVDAGGMPSGNISGVYELVATATAAGEAELLSSTSLKIVTGVTATASEVVSTDSPSSSYSPFSFRLGSVTGSHDATTSWVFQIGSKKTALTPIAGYDTVLSSKASELSQYRIPYIVNDLANTSGVNSTLNFSGNFLWNHTNDTLDITGNIEVSDQLWVKDHLRINHLASTPSYTGLGSSIKTFQTNGIVFTVDSNGKVQVLTNVVGNVYDEEVDVLANINTNDNTTLPEDTNSLIGNDVLATATNASAVITVSSNNHGLTTGDLITTYMSDALGGIPAVDLTKTNTAVTVIDVNTFSYVADSSATSTESKFIDSIVTERVRYYLVGDKELEVYLNGVIQSKGVDYNEVGAYHTQSNQIEWLKDISAQSPNNVIKYRIDANGGQTIISQSVGGSGTLQDAYNGGSVINIASGTPLTLNGPSGEDLAVINGDMTVTGLIN